MAGMSHHLFEDPLYIYILLGIAEIALAWTWYVRRTRQWLLALLPAPVLAAAVALTAHLVVTDAEKIASALEEIAAGVEQGDLAPAELYVDVDCRSPGRGGRIVDKAELLGRARREMDRWKISAARPGSVRTEVAGANATTTLGTRITFSGGQLGGQVFDIGWRLQWARRPAGWRIVRVEITRPEFLRNLRFGSLRPRSRGLVARSGRSRWPSQTAVH